MQSAFALAFLLPLLCAAQPAMLSNTGCHKFQENVPTYLSNAYYQPSVGEDELDHGFTAFDDEYLFKCKPFLDSSKTYYLADVSSFDDEKFVSPGSTLSTLFGSVDTALNPKCAQNVLGHWCHTFFKECQEVDEGVWVPALMCRSACEERKAVWDTCVGRIEEAGLLSDVNTKLSSVVCDPVANCEIDRHDLSCLQLFVDCLVPPFSITPPSPPSPFLHRRNRVRRM